MDAAHIGKRYRLSFHNDKDGNSHAAEYATFQFNFKPTSIDPSLPGMVTFSNSNDSEVTLQTTDGGEEKFLGKRTNPEGEYILSIGPEGCSISKVSVASVSLRHIGAEPTSKSAPEQARMPMTGAKLQQLIGDRGKKRVQSAKKDKQMKSVPNEQTIKSGSDSNEPSAKPSSDEQAIKTETIIADSNQQTIKSETINNPQTNE